MWSNYYEPDFVLPPRHAHLFRIAAGFLSDEVGWKTWEDFEWDGRNAPFARLTQGQKQLILLTVARALLRESSEPPAVTAVVAATVAEVHDALRTLIAFEIEDDEQPTAELRSLLLAAMHEKGYWDEINDAIPPDEEPEVPPAETCADFDEWELFIEALETDILEDYDFAMEENFMDADPARSAALKDQLNIDPDYFTDVPDDPPRDRFPALRRELHELLHVHGQQASPPVEREGWRDGGA